MMNENKNLICSTMDINYMEYDILIDVFCTTRLSKGSCQKLLSGFFPLRGYPHPPYSLIGKSFFEKTHSGNGGYPLPPLNGKSAKLFRTKNELNKVKNGPKRPYDRPKKAKNV